MAARSGHGVPQYSVLSTWHSSGRRRREALVGILFTLPWLLGFLMFALGPVLSSLYLSFTKYSIGGEPHWIGFENYAKAISGRDNLFWPSVGHTVMRSSAEPAGPRRVPLRPAAVSNAARPDTPTSKTHP